MQQDKIWDFHQGENVSSFDGSSDRLNFLANSTIPSDSTVLNIGVGNGFLEELLLDRNLKVYALDPSESAINRLREKLKLDSTEAKSGYSQNMDFESDTFDVVFMSEVIEHLDENVLSDTLNEVKRVLKHGGRFIGTVPADEILASNVVVCPDCGKVFHRWVHVQSFSRERLLEVLSRSFDKVKIRRMYFGNWSTLNWKGKLLHVFKKLSSLLRVKGTNENYYFVGYKS